MGRIVHLRDATANDSDKSFTVPAGKVWDMKMIRIVLVTTATVGNRILTISINSAGAAIWYFASAAHAASTTREYMLGFQGVYDDVATTVFTLIAGIPPMLLEEGDIVRVYDSATIDAAADDLTVDMHYIEFDA